MDAFPEKQSDVGLYCLSRPVCQNIQEHYSLGSTNLDPKGHSLANSLRLLPVPDHLGVLWDIVVPREKVEEGFLGGLTEHTRLL